MTQRRSTGLDAGNFHVQAESKLFVREPEIVATMGGRGCSSSWTAGARPRCMVGSSRLGQRSADVPASSGEVAIRRRAQDELQTRTFASAVDPINYDQSNEEDTRGHISDPVMEAEPAPDDPQNLLGPIGEPTSFKPHRTL
eukprot:s15895_g1.t1